MNEKINRRSFFQRMTAAGALIATSQLPAIAEDKPEVFPKRGRFERLSLNYNVVNIGLKESFSVLHISDTHLTAAYPYENENKQVLNKKRTQTFGGRQEEALRDSIAWAKLHNDYIIHTGDLIDWQSQANYDLVKKYFGDAMAGCMGNHEYSPDMWLSEIKEAPSEAYKQHSAAKLQSVYPFNITFQSQVVKGVNFITLDNVYATVTPHQVELFKAEVKRGYPIVLCMHVPFHTENIWRATVKFWRRVNEGKNFVEQQMPNPTGDYKTQQTDPTTRDFIAYLKTEPLLKAILAGHIHLTTQERFSPTAIQYTVAGNFGFAATEMLFV